MDFARRALAAALLLAGAGSALVLGAGKAEPQPTAAPDSTVELRRFAPRPPRLSEEEAQRVRAQVLHQCDAGTVPNAELPWYFHYELSRELRRRGDDQRALDELLKAIEERPLSSRQARAYGMWFVDYRPYLEAAELHASLGNWGCAAAAIGLSSQQGELEDLAEDPHLQQLRKEIDAAREPSP